MFALFFKILCVLPCKKQFTPLNAENYDCIRGILQSVVASGEKLGAPPLKEKTTLY